MIYLAYSLICLLVAAAFKVLVCSFGETADAGVERLHEKYPALRRSREIYEKKWKLLTTTLSLVVVIFQVGAILFVYMAYHQDHITDIATGAAYLALIFLMLFLLEMLPPIVANIYSDRICAMALPATIALSYMFAILTVPLHYLGCAVKRKMASQSDATDRPTPEDEIISLMEQADAHDMELHEKEFIRSVFEFDKTDVHEIMTPRIDMAAVEDIETVGESVARIRDMPYSRFPVYHETLDNVQGVLHVKELMRLLSLGREDETAGNVASEVEFVPESMKIAKLFDLMKRKHTHLAMVVDEYGGTAGLVALEDVIEELIGEIQDESDKERPGIVRLPDGSVILEAREPVDEVNELMEIDIPVTEEYDSVGGYIFYRLNRIPTVGETIEGQNYRITVQQASAKEIKTIRIFKKEEEVWWKNQQDMTT